jgi:hypothetical protein
MKIWTSSLGNTTMIVCPNVSKILKNSNIVWNLGDLSISHEIICEGYSKLWISFEHFFMYDPCFSKHLRWSFISHNTSAHHLSPGPLSLTTPPSAPTNTGPSHPAVRPGHQIAARPPRAPFPCTVLRASSAAGFGPGRARSCPGQAAVGVSELRHGVWCRVPTTPSQVGDVASLLLLPEWVTPSATLGEVFAKY